MKLYERSLSQGELIVNIFRLFAKVPWKFKSFENKNISAKTSCKQI